MLRANCVLPNRPVPAKPSLVEIALELADYGLPVFPCNGGKRPCIAKGQPGGEGFRDATTDPESIRRLFSHPAAKLIGVPTGARSGFDVLDVDPRHQGDAWEAANRHRLPETRIHRTQSGGRHYVFRHRDGVLNSAGRIAPGVDVRGEGGYIIHPPSPGYSVIHEADPADWPAWLLDLILKPDPVQQRPASRAPAEPISSSRLERFIDTVLDGVRTAPDGQKHDCLVRAARAIGGVAEQAGLSDEGAIARLMQALPGTVRDWSLAQRTAAWGLAEGRKKPLTLADRPNPRAKPASTPRKPEHPSGETPGSAALTVASPTSKPDKPHWTDACQVDKQGELRGNVFNVLLALSNDPELVELLAYDQMRHDEILAQHIPGSGLKSSVPRTLQDTDVTAIQACLQRQGLQKVGGETTHAAVALRARQRAFHPVRRYLNSLAWDGEPRLSTWLHSYLGAEDTSYTRAIGRMFLLAMIARVFKPGCKADYMMVLEGGQGVQKSTVCGILAGQWFSDSLPNLSRDDVRVSQHIRGKWLIEVAEMSALSKADTEELKAFLTRAEECFTPKYGRKEVREPRQCVFIGTTNQSAYLRDETGGRRFWPVKAGLIDAEALERDRDQLFAEAVQAFQAGENWWPSREFEAEHIKPEQEARFEADLWEQPIADWIEHKSRVLILEVARGALSLQTDKLQTSVSRRISAILTSLEWASGRRGTGGLRYWYPPGNPLRAGRD